MAQERNDGDRHDHATGDGQPAAEWIVAVLAALLVLGAIGQVMIDGFSGPKGPPALVVSVDSVAPSRTGYRASFTVRNEGGTTASQVTITGSLREDSTTVETSRVTMDYVPSQTSRSGGLFFTNDPRAYRLEIRATGYDEP